MEISFPTHLQKNVLVAKNQGKSYKYTSSECRGLCSSYFTLPLGPLGPFTLEVPIATSHRIWTYSIYHGYRREFCSWISGNFLFPNWVSSLFIYVLRFLACRVAIGEHQLSCKLNVEILMCFATCSPPSKWTHEKSTATMCQSQLQGMCYEANGSANDFARSSSLKQAYHCSIYLPMFV